MLSRGILKSVIHPEDGGRRCLQTSKQTYYTKKEDHKTIICVYARARVREGPGVETLSLFYAGVFSPYSYGYVLPVAVTNSVP